MRTSGGGGRALRQRPGASRDRLDGDVRSRGDGGAGSTGEGGRADDARGGAKVAAGGEHGAHAARAQLRLRPRNALCVEC